MTFDGVKLSPMTRRMVKIAGGVAVLGVALVLAFFGTINAYRPSIDAHADLYALQRPIAYTFVDESGAIVGHHGAVVGERLKLADMPDFLPAAFLAMEDRKFYSHEGVDWRAMVRALTVNFRAGDTVQGGSTITQQLVKILFLTPERTIDRKLREIGGAWTLEENLSKEQILELYLNRIYLGSGAYGVDGAARIYFGKSAREVTLPEAAMLAALTRAPSAYTPRHDLEQARARAGIVLDAMIEAGLYGPEAVRAAKAAPANISSRATDLARAYFFDAAAEEVKRLVPGPDRDLVVLTTFDARLQNAAHAAVEAVLTAKSASALRASQASLVAMEPDGAVVALVGGRDYAASQFNRATQAKRQPGSAFKAFVYLAAMESGLSPWDYRFYGDSDVTLADGLARSLNSVATNLQQEVGTRNVIRAAERMGIRSELRAVPSLALGTSEVTPLELTGAYAGFASGGYKATPYFVLEARTPDGNIVYRRDAPLAPRVIRENVALDMNAMLYGVVETGTARGARLTGRDVAGKTGTSNDYRDAWFVGYTPQMVTGVWLGNDDFSPMKNVTGGSLPTQIWKRFMTAALKGKPALPLLRSEPEVFEPEPQIAYDNFGNPYTQYYGYGETRPEQGNDPRPVPDPYYTPYNPRSGDSRPEYDAQRRTERDRDWNDDRRRRFAAERAYRESEEQRAWEEQRNRDPYAERAERERQRREEIMQRAYDLYSDRSLRQPYDR